MLERSIKFKTNKRALTDVPEVNASLNIARGKNLITKGAKGKEHLVKTSNCK